MGHGYYVDENQIGTEPEHFWPTPLMLYLEIPHTRRILFLLKLSKCKEFAERNILSRYDGRG